MWKKNVDDLDMELVYTQNKRNTICSVAIILVERRKSNIICFEAMALIGKKRNTSHVLEFKIMTKLNEQKRKFVLGLEVL